MSLNARQERFVAEYLIDQNATQAAIRAGYAPTGAGRNADRLMKNNEIAEAIAEKHGKRMERLEITADRVLQEIAALAFSDPRALYDDRGRLLPIKEWPDYAAKAIAGIETMKRNLTAGDGEQEEVVKIKVWDKPKNLELLAKHFALLTDRVEHSGDVSFRWMKDESD